MGKLVLHAQSKLIGKISKTILKGFIMRSSLRTNTRCASDIQMSFVISNAEQVMFEPISEAQTLSGLSEFKALDKL